MASSGYSLSQLNGSSSKKKKMTKNIMFSSYSPSILLSDLIRCPIRLVVLQSLLNAVLASKPHRLGTSVATESTFNCSPIQLVS